MNYKIKSYELNNNLINNTTILLFKIVFLLHKLNTIYLIKTYYLILTKRKYLQ